MSTPSSTIFVLGQPGSASATAGALQDLSQQGQAVLDTIEGTLMEAITSFERKQLALTARDVAAGRLLPEGVLAQLSLTDFTDINQSQTTATVRIDSACATLRSRSQMTAARIATQNFATSAGTAEALDNSQSLLRVHAAGGGAPVGTFNLTLTEAAQISMLAFDLVPTPSQPQVSVSVSADGINYVAARTIALNGSGLTAWLAPQRVLYIRLVITPTHPDAMGGSLYTFGILDCSTNSTVFQLRSYLVSRALRLNPETLNLQVLLNASGTVIAYLSLQTPGNPPVFLAIPSDGVVSVPGAVSSLNSQIPLDGSGNLQNALPAGLYPASLKVIDTGNGAPIPVAFGLPVNLSGLDSQYIAVNGTTMTLVPYTANDVGRLFQVSYISGPAQLEAYFKLDLSTSDYTQTPIVRSLQLASV